MVFCYIISNFYRRTVSLSLHSVWFSQKSPKVNWSLLSRTYRKSCSDNILQRSIQVLPRVQHTELSKQYLQICPECFKIKHANFASESTRPQSRSARQSVRDKSKTKNGVETLSKDSQKGQPIVNGNQPESAAVDEAKLSVFQRFKKTYKEHAKILIVVHLLTSSVWFGSFFYAAHMGIDIIPVLEKLGFSEKIINPFRNSSLGDVALAYLMYKLATPARYTVTLAGTNFAIKYLRKMGKVPAKQKGLVAEAVKYGRTQTRQHVTHRFNNVKSGLEVRRLKMRHDAGRFSTRLKSRWQSVSRNRTFGGHQREKLYGRKTDSSKS